MSMAEYDCDLGAPRPFVGLSRNDEETAKRTLSRRRVAYLESGVPEVISFSDGYPRETAMSPHRSRRNDA